VAAAGFLLILLPDLVLFLPNLIFGGLTGTAAATPDVQAGAAQCACLPVGTRDYRVAA
jgi:hypothetical protein